MVSQETLYKRFEIVTDEAIKAAESGEYTPLDIANIMAIGQRLAKEDYPSGVFCCVELDGVLNTIAKRMRDRDYPTEK